MGVASTLLVAVSAMNAGALGAEEPPASASAASAQRQVLLVSEARGFVHDSIPAAVAVFEDLGRRSTRYDVVHLRDGTRALTPARLRRADGVIFANTSGELPFSAAQRSALLSFVRRGGGVVATHSAADAFLGTWPAYGRLLGARFERHDRPRTQRVVIEDRRHPATRGLGGSLRIFEEFYEFQPGPDPRRVAHVLARLDTGANGADRPLVWCRREGRGRVFYDALGHFRATWRDRRHRRLVAGGVAWSLGLTPGACAPPAASTEAFKPPPSRSG